MYNLYICCCQSSKKTFYMQTNWRKSLFFVIKASYLNIVPVISSVCFCWTACLSLSVRVNMWPVFLRVSGDTGRGKERGREGETVNRNDGLQAHTCAATTWKKLQLQLRAPTPTLWFRIVYQRYTHLWNEVRLQRDFCAKDEENC